MGSEMCIRDSREGEDIAPTHFEDAGLCDANLIELWDTVREIKHLALNECRDNADFSTCVMGDPELIQGEGYVMLTRFGYFKLVNRRAFSYANFHNTRFVPLPLRAS